MFDETIYHTKDDLLVYVKTNLDEAFPNEALFVGKIEISYEAITSTSAPVNQEPQVGCHPTCFTCSGSSATQCLSCQSVQGAPVSVLNNGQCVCSLNAFMNNNVC